MKKSVKNYRKLDKKYDKNTLKIQKTDQKSGNNVAK